MKGLESPEIVTELRSFLDLCIIFRFFMSVFARIAAWLNRKLLNDQLKNFDQLTDEEVAAMTKL